MIINMIYIIIPTYNEAENISKLVEKIFLLDLEIKVLIIDDNSPDGTGEMADRLADKYNIEVLHRSGKMGIGSAYIQGFKKALLDQAEYIMEMDADFSHDPNDIPKLVAAAKEGYDLIIGSRRIKGGDIVGWGFLRRFMSRGAMDFSRVILGLKTKDVTAGFRCYRKSMIAKLPLDKINSSGYSFQEELVWLTERLQGKIKEVPVIFNDRAKGKSKLSYKEIFKFFYIVIKLRFTSIKKYYE